MRPHLRRLNLMAADGELPTRIKRTGTAFDRLTPPVEGIKRLRAASPKMRALIRHVQE